MYEKTLRQLKIGLIIIATTLFVGTIGYMLIEGWNLLDSFYMVIISVTTTGFKEVSPLSELGRLFTILVIIFGFGGIAYTGGKGAQIILETQIFRRRRMSKKLEELTDHYIVCGYGRMGKYICAELQSENAPFVVIENNNSKIEALTELEYLYVNGDSTKDETLINAGIERAKGLVAVLSTDADNVFTILSARELNPDIYIVARAIEEETEPKLIKAGADRVVKPYEAGGTRMAEFLIRPGIIEFIDVVARDRSVDLNIQEVLVNENSPLVNKTLSESTIRKEVNIIIVYVNKKDGTGIYNPQSSTKIEAGDKLIAIGEKSNLLKLNDLAIGG